MITSDNQLKVSRGKLGQFTSTLGKLETEVNPNPIALARIGAIRDQIASIENEISEYERLRSGKVKEIQTESLLDLPNALVKARIARSITQTDLAELLGVKPQQVQRWEDDGYRKASLERLAQVADALGLKVSKQIRISGSLPFTIAQVRKGLTSAGFSREVVDTRILPSDVEELDLGLAISEIDARLISIIGRDTASLLRSNQTLSTSQLAFKLPRSAEQVRTRAYASYVEGLCRIIAKSLAVPATLPGDWRSAHKVLFSDGISLDKAVRNCWNLGIPVLPLSDSIAFHGACWQEAGKSVIALKQNSSDEARWLVDLVHEFYHAANPASPGDFFLIEAEETSAERRDSLDEKRAQRFATEAITNGRTEVLTTAIFNIAGGRGPALRSATIEVARKEQIPVGLLANLLAHRLAENDFDWWGVAANLQEKSDQPWKIVRRIFLENIKLDQLSNIERKLILQAVES